MLFSGSPLFASQKYKHHFAYSGSTLRREIRDLDFLFLCKVTTLDHLLVDVRKGITDGTKILFCFECNLQIASFLQRLWENGKRTGSRWLQQSLDFLQNCMAVFSPFFRPKPRLKTAGTLAALEV